MTQKLKVLSAGAVKRGVTRVAAEYARTTGNEVAVEFATAPEVARRISGGELVDVIVATPAIMDEFAERGKIIAASRGFVGRSRMGVIIHADAPAAGLDGVEAFKRVMLGASAVVYNSASSGIYAATLMKKLGLAEALASRIIVVPTGSAVMEYVAAHPPAAVGLGQISEVMVMIEKGCRVKLAGPLPHEIQNITDYSAAAAAAAPEAARALAAALTSEAARKVFAATGID